MCKILIFGGTTEGRILAEYCHEQGIHVWVSVATGYGEMVLPESKYLHIHKSPMDACEMADFIREKEIALVLDATHPYAAVVSQNILIACRKAEVRHMRVFRETSEGFEGGEHEGYDGSIVWVDSVDEAVIYLDKKPGNILVTTGSKELSRYTAMDSWEERVFARVLPTLSVISACEQMGIKGNHLIGMQGPFSVEMNRAMIKQYDIRYLVTKEAGNAGGFPEKMRAAAECGITAVVVGRPVKEKGIRLEEAMEELKGWETGEEPEIQPEKRRVSLIGTGMGGQDQMTMGAWKALQDCDVVFGAERMLAGISQAVPKARKIPFYLSKDILPWLVDHAECRRIGILYSGDTGFYSGAKKMAEALSQEPYGLMYDVSIFPGISSVSYLCSRLKTSWEDVRLVSLHGRECDIIEELKKNSRVFALLDGTNRVKNLCLLLKEQGFDRVRISVGERLSYSDERITVGTPEMLENKEFDILSVLLIEREEAPCRCTCMP
ncbi:precorrin-6A reductase [Lacrimispora sp.]|uniref:precorrin-6A reductase n=1 Tax=Lacrimispora sp. TaxID=2719234 RepID=UPI002FDB957F